MYEPPVHAERRAAAVQRAIEHLEAGEHEEAILVFLPEVAGLSADELALVRAIPEVWSRFLAAAPTGAREAAAVLSRGWDPTRYRSIRVPTLHLTGALTEPPVYLSHDKLVDAVPHAEHGILEGQRHIAFAMDPQAFADRVLTFTAARRPT